MPIIAAIVPLIVIASVVALYFAGGPKSVTPGAPQPTTASTPAELAKQATPEPPKVPPERLSIVVLPFTNLGGDPTQDYLADVITEELTTSLSRIVGSFVIARSTAFTYKGKAIDAKQIGKELGSATYSKEARSRAAIECGSLRSSSVLRPARISGPNNSTRIEATSCRCRTRLSRA